MRALVVSQYYAPEIGATQNRMLAFVDALLARGHSVTVVCEQPNHPRGVFHEGYGRAPLRRERRPALTVNRLWVYTSPQKTTARRLLFYGTFSVSAFALTSMLPSHDVVFATSPPLPGAVAAAVAARVRTSPLVLDVRDIWPAAAEALGELSNRPALRVFERMERWLYQTSAVVTATTRSFCGHIDAVAGRPIAMHLPNGALDDLVALPPKPAPANRVFRIGYFGNFGIAQGLRIVLDAAIRLRDEPIEFRLVGGGPLEAELHQSIVDLRLRNVEVCSAVETEKVGDLMLSCQALLVPLRNHPLMAGFIPSKVYDAMAVGRPAIVAARGEAAAFVNEHHCGVAIDPENGAALADEARRLAHDRELAAQLGAAGKAAAPAYARSVQSKRLCELLEAVAAGPGGTAGGDPRSPLAAADSTCPSTQ